MAIILKLGELMDGRGLDDEGLARLMGLEIEGVRKLREGDVGAIRFSTLDGLCRALGCSPGDVLGYLPDGESGTGGRGIRAAPGGMPAHLVDAAVVLPTGEMAWRAEDAIAVVRLLEMRSVRILGGDVYKFQRGEAVASGCSWYIEEGDAAYRAMRSRDYIKGFASKNGDDWLYVIVADPAEGAAGDVGSDPTGNHFDY